jgi:hypothetical protein
MEKIVEKIKKYGNDLKIMEKFKKIWKKYG